MRTWPLVWADVKQLTRDRIAAFTFVATLIACGLAGWTGHSRLSHARAAQMQVLSAAAAEQTAQRQHILMAEPAEASLLGSSVTQTNALPVPRLLDFSIGRSAIEPASFSIRMRSRSDTVFRNYQNGNPELLAHGPVDLTLVVAVLCPLLLIAVGYGVVSGDRESAIASLILAQSGSYGTVVIARSISRFLLILLPPLGTGVVLLATSECSAERLAAAFWWMTATTISVAFWWALVLLTNSFCKTSETALLTLGGLYVSLTFVLVALSVPLSQMAFTPQSRLTQIAKQRRAQTEITDSFENDHSNLTADTVQQNRLTMRHNYELAERLEAKMAPIVSASENALERQQRVQAAVGLLSPAMATVDLLSRLAGTDQQTYATLRREAREQTRDFRASIARSVKEERNYAPSDFDSAPVFRPVLPRPHVALLMTWLFSIAALTAAVAVGRLRTLSI